MVRKAIIAQQFKTVTLKPSKGLGSMGSDSDSISVSKIRSSDPNTSVYMASEKVCMNLDEVGTLIKSRYWNIWHSLKNIYKNPSITRRLQVNKNENLSGIFESAVGTVRRDVTPLQRLPPITDTTKQSWLGFSTAYELVLIISLMDLEIVNVQKMHDFRATLHASLTRILTANDADDWCALFCGETSLRWSTLDSMDRFKIACARDTLIQFYGNETTSAFIATNNSTRSVGAVANDINLRVNLRAIPRCSIHQLRENVEVMRNQAPPIGRIRLLSSFDRRRPSIDESGD